jgi:DNA invertase Pin-like site-specific DNA recombinase
MARPRKNVILEPEHPDGREPQVVGYARVSTFEQNLDSQVAALTRAGVDETLIFIDKISAEAKRPNFLLLQEYLRPGDTLVVYSLSRIARNVADLIAFEKKLRDRNITLKSITESIDTNTAVGKLAFNIQSAFAQFERDITVERTRAGIEARRAAGLPLGRPRVIEEKTLVQVKKDLLAGKLTVEQIAAKHHITKERIRYYFPGGRHAIDRKQKPKR